MERAICLTEGINNMENDLIGKRVAIDALAKFVPYAICDESTESYTNGLTDAYNLILQLPSAQPEIIRCNVCRHWHQTTGEMKGFGLGDCDYLEKKLVTCNGYCYWAERRQDG